MATLSRQSARTPIGIGLITQAVEPALWRFLLVGGFSYLVNQATLVTLYILLFRGPSDAVVLNAWRLDMALLVASALALELSILVRFALNDLWTFRNRAALSWARRLYLFHASSLISPLIAIAVVNVFTPMLGLHYLLSNSIGIVLGLAWNWYCSSRVVWRPSPHPNIIPSGAGKP